LRSIVFIGLPWPMNAAGMIASGMVPCYPFLLRHNGEAAHGTIFCAPFCAAMDLAAARELAMSLPEATEQPHFDMASWRIRGKIFATAPPDGQHLHVFVHELETKAAVAEDPAAFEELWWGKTLSGVRVILENADPERVFELLEGSWRRRAPKRLAAEYRPFRE
jgi:hypothetical protein